MTKHNIGWQKSDLLLTIPVPRILSAGLLLFILVSLLTVLPKAALSAEESLTAAADSIEKPFGERKTLRGEIGAMSAEGLALVYKKDKQKKSESEMWLPFNKTVRFSGYADREDIQQGDEAVVTYEENKEGTLRVLREINFVQRNEQAKESDEAEASDETEAEE